MSLLFYLKTWKISYKKQKKRLKIEKKNKKKKVYNFWPVTETLLNYFVQFLLSRLTQRKPYKMLRDFFFISYLLLFIYRRYLDSLFWCSVQNEKTLFSITKSDFTSATHEQTATDLQVNAHTTPIRLHFQIFEQVYKHKNRFHKPKWRNNLKSITVTAQYLNPFVSMHTSNYFPFPFNFCFLIFTN